MRTVTATEASRSLAALLDEVERGQTIVITRGGRRIAAVSPAGAGTGADVLALLSDGAPDGDFADDIRAARDAVGSCGSASSPAWTASPSDDRLRHAELSATASDGSSPPAPALV